MSETVDQKILGDKPKWFNWQKKGILVLFIIILIFGWFKYGSVNMIDATIASTDSKDGVFLVFTDKGTFKNVDSWWHLKFKSSDVQGMAAPGSTVTLKVYGLRSGFTSSYKNIISIEKRK